MRFISTPAVLTLGLALLIAAQDASAGCRRHVYNNSHSTWTVSFHDFSEGGMHAENKTTPPPNYPRGYRGPRKPAEVTKIDGPSFTIAPGEIVSIWYAGSHQGDTWGSVTMILGQYAADFNLSPPLSGDCVHIDHYYGNTYPIDLNRPAGGDITFKGDDLTVYRGVRK